MKSAFVLALFFVTISGVASHKIMMVMAFASKSHRNAFDPVAAELVKRGNEVTVLSSMKVSKAIKGVTEIPLKQVGQFFEDTNLSFFQGTPDDKDFFNLMLQILYNVSRLTLNDPEVVKMVKNPKAFNFDVVVIDAVFNEFVLALGHHLGSANIIFSPGLRFGSLAWGLNIPHPPSYLPTGMEATTDRMTFGERLRNTFSHVGFHYTRHHKMFPRYDQIISEVIPNSPTIAELENKVSFLIINSHPAINPPMPNMPYSVEVGCIHCLQAKALPKDLEDFMQSSEDAGVIYFSLGSVTKGNSTPLEMRDKLVKAFAQLPQKVLWKYEIEIKDLPKNIKLIKWAPQQDLLEHKKLRLFITHGGGLSTQEAAYHGCPLLGFPLSADQWGNMAMAKQRGFAEYLDWRKFTVEDFLNTVNQIVKNDRYRKTAEQVSALLKDQPQPPVERAAFWIEYVARHKGAPHLKSAAENLNFYQYFLLDIFGVLLLGVFIIYMLLRKVCQMLCRPKSTSLTKKTN